MKKKLLLLLMVPVLALSSCKKDDPEPTPIGGGGGVTASPNSLKINGDTWSNRLFNMDNTSENIGYWESAVTQTTVIGSGSGDSLDISINMLVGGNKPSTFTFATKTSLTVSIINKKRQTSMDYNSQPGSGTVIITKYGAVGEKIEGTYSGNFKEATTGAVVEIKEGKFSVVRGADV